MYVCVYEHTTNTIDIFILQSLWIKCMYVYVGVCFDSYATENGGDRYM